MVACLQLRRRRRPPSPPARAHLVPLPVVAEPLLQRQHLDRDLVPVDPAVLVALAADHQVRGEALQRDESLCAVGGVDAELAAAVGGGWGRLGAVAGG